MRGIEKMAKEENLKPVTERSKAEAREISRKGGIKSGEARRAKKTMREMLKYLLEQDIQNSKGEKKTTLEAVMVAQLKQALKGDTKAATFIRDTIGEKPLDKQEITGKNGEPLAVKKVFVTPDEVDKVQKHIKDIIND